MSIKVETTLEWDRGTNRSTRTSKIPRERIGYVDHFFDAGGNVNKSMPSSRITTELVDVGGSTKVVSHAEYASPAALKEVLEMGVLEGVSDTWDRLAVYLRDFTRK